MGSTIKKTGYNGRRVMYFNTWSKRDTDVPEAEQVERWNAAFTQYCKKCSDDFGLEHGKCPRLVDNCGICGSEDVFIYGRLSTGDPKIEDAHSIIRCGEKHHAE